MLTITATIDSIDYSLWLLLVISVLNFMFPKFAWWCAEGWKFKNVKPSRLWLFLNRFCSALAAIGVLCIIFLKVENPPESERSKPKPPRPASEHRK